jgi:hypothetical protein
MAQERAQAQERPEPVPPEPRSGLPEEQLAPVPRERPGPGHRQEPERSDCTRPEKSRSQARLILSETSLGNSYAGEIEMPDSDWSLLSNGDSYQTQRSNHQFT